MPSRPPRRWRTIAVVAALGSLAVASTVQVPYFTISPGDARPLAAAISVDGPSFPPEGSIFLTTVSVASRRVTVLQAIEGWLNPTVDVVEEEVIIPPEADRDTVRQLNLDAMSSSKEVALGVAFERLGYDAITGEGADVLDVVEGAPADGALAVGDVIVAVDGERIEVSSEAVEVLGRHAPGDRVTLRVRNPQGEERTVEVVLARHPEDHERPLLGVSLGTRKERLELPFAVDIATDDIGGPSAGLAITLELLDLLTEGELTGGLKVAATGTIEPDGTVGQVGGVAQKAVAVEEAGIDVFLVPAAEVREARRHADGLRIEGVADLDDALRILRSLGGDPVRRPS